MWGRTLYFTNDCIVWIFLYNYFYNFRRGWLAFVVGIYSTLKSHPVCFFMSSLISTQVKRWQSLARGAMLVKGRWRWPLSRVNTTLGEASQAAADNYPNPVPFREFQLVWVPTKMGRSRDWNISSFWNLVGAEWAWDREAHLQGTPRSPRS